MRRGPDELHDARIYFSPLSRNYPPIGRQFGQRENAGACVFSALCIMCGRGGEALTGKTAAGSACAFDHRLVELRD